MKNISIVGLGRLGLPLAVCFAKDFRVIGIDIDPAVVEAINARRVPERIYEPGLAEMLENVGENLIATDDIEAVQHTSMTIVLVATPSEEDGSFSLEYVLNVCRDLGRALHQKKGYHVVTIASTVIPGDCDGPIREALEEASGKKVGKGLGLCYCPEFVALGNVIHGFLEPDFVLIGASDIKAAFSLQEIYTKFCLNDPPIVQMNLVNAEMAKLTVNCYISTKMTFANVIAELCEQLPGADVNVVMDAVGLDSRIGRKYLAGATAYGGLTFPMAMHSLLKVAKSANVELPLIEMVDSVNRWQNHRLAEIVQDWRIGAKIRIGILGLTYKPGINAVEGSAGIALLGLLHPSESLIAYDPMAQVEQSVESAQTCADWSDIIVVTTPWPEFKEIEFHQGQVVIDCWRMLDEGKVEDAGAKYIPLGRYIE